MGNKLHVKKILERILSMENQGFVMFGINYRQVQGILDTNQQFLNVF